MSFQTTVRDNITFGVPGELFSDGPVRAEPWTLISTKPNVIGYAYTYANEGMAQVGGKGPFLGILVHPKHYASYGTLDGTLAPTMELANGSIGELLTMGAIIVNLSPPADAGDTVIYDTTTGALSAISAGSEIPKGKAKLPNTVISRYASNAYKPADPELTVITLTN